MVFSEKSLSCVKNDKSFLDRVIFWDKAYFSLSGLINKQNTRFLADSKPSPIERKRFDGKVLVWTGFSWKLKLPIVIVSSHTLDQCEHSELLTNEVGESKFYNKMCQTTHIKFLVRKIKRIFHGGVISTTTEF